MDQILRISDPHSSFIGTVFLTDVFLRTAKEYILAIDLLREQDIVTVINIKRGSIRYEFPINQVRGLHNG
ncbi:hypothetical protein D3C77_469190 [compost metagenome]